MTSRPNEDEAREGSAITVKTPAEERRVILVASDARYDEMVRSVDWRKAAPALVASLAALPMLGALTVPSVVLGAAARQSSLVRKGLHAVKGRLNELVQRGEIPLPRLLPSHASSTFAFPDGEPRDGTAYLLHPTDHGRYLLPESAAIEIARERLALFSSVTSALGARRVVLAHAEVRSRSQGGRTNVPLPKIAMDLGLSVSVESNGRVARSVVREYAAPTSSITFPEPFRAEIERDPELSSMVRERLESRLLSSRFSMRVEDDAISGAEVALALANKGVRVGTGKREHVDSTWVLEVEFWPL